jgi:hypothetical protein
MKPYWKPLLFFVAFFALLVASQLSSPKPINWTPTFSGTDKNPLGTYILLSRLSDLFPNQNLTINSRSLYDILYLSADYRADLHLSNTASQASCYNIILINQHLDLDSLDARTLLQFVAAGNSAFLAASSFGKLLEDTLRLNTRHIFSLPFLDISRKDSLMSDTSRFNFTFEFHKREVPYQFVRLPRHTVFTSYDTARTTVLSVDALNRPVFIRMQFGDGAFYLFSNELLLTNYFFLLPDGAEYIAKVLSYLPIQATIWDEYYKPFKWSYSPLRFVLEHDALRHAYYLALVGIALFLFVEGKRRQRAIAVITPPRNTTLEFVETVGRLYFQHGDHKDLAEKKVRYFFDFIRTHFYFDAISFAPEFYAALSGKSGIPLQDIQRLFADIEHIQHLPAVSELELLRLVKEIDKFYEAITPRTDGEHALSKPD